MDTNALRSLDPARTRPVLEGARPHLAAPEALLERFCAVRSASLRLAGGLSPEDQCVQSMPDASPTKWHLAHTSWFFEALILQRNDPHYRCFDARYAYLFNSYYEALGARHARELRGMLTRPALDEVLRYRRHVDDAVASLFRSHAVDGPMASLVELGLHHEQQHQELMLTDIKHAFYLNPLRPAYQRAESIAVSAPAALRWCAHRGGIQNVGHEGPTFAFDNEGPRHAVLLRPFELASRMVTCGEFLEFIRDGGYRRADLWLSDGWATVQKQGWAAPLYWEADGDGGFRVFTLHGMQPLNPDEAACHLSYYEACAYAAWAHARLPTEFEWEAAAAAWPASAPEPICRSVWQWTRSSYDPYPGFQASADPVGEYNGKFMVGQLVLRGGSFATPPGHIRITYRNFFPPGARWQFSGLRLARDA
jgi:ergothioneine biosynthesis protein EgtB